MAMHKPKKQRRFQDGGDVNEAEMKQRGLDISNRAREEGAEKTGFFQRLREGNIDDPNSVAYKKYGAGRARLDDQIATAKEKLAGEVQEKVAANKTSDGDVSEYDRRVDAAASAPSRAPTLPARPGQGAAMAKPRMTKPAAKKEETSVESAVMAGEARRRQKSAVINDEDRKRQSSRSAVMTDEARKRKAGKEAAFQRAQAEAKTPEGKAKLDERIKGQALERVSPEEYIGPAFGLKTLNKLAKKLATPKVKEYKPTMLPAPKAASKTDTKALEAPRPKLSYDKAGAKERERAERAAERMKQMRRDNAERGGSNADSINLKKGGRVTASSASKRADGIAQRGKTRGKVY